jgi:hypothetical protein
MRDTNQIQRKPHEDLRSMKLCFCCLDHHGHLIILDIFESLFKI